MKNATALGAIGLAVIASACNLGPQDSTRVSIAFEQVDCVSLQNPANGGSRMEGTFVAVVGAEFPPQTELRRGLHPCSGDVERGDLPPLEVRVPEGNKRAIAVAIVGPSLDVPSLQVPELTLEGQSFTVREPRTIFFGGGKLLNREQILPGVDGAPASVTLDLHPFINVLGRVRRGASPAAAHVTFLLPETSGDCLQSFDTEDSPSLTKVYDFDVRASGSFLASVPYRATAPNCDNEGHGNEIFALVEAKEGDAVALYVPGRAFGPGQGLEPGMLLRQTMIFLRDRRAAASIIVSSATLIPRSDVLEVFVSGWADVDSLPDSLSLPIKRLPDGEPTDFAFEVAHKQALGEGSFGQPLQSYNRVRLFDARRPFAAKLHTASPPPAGEYVVKLPGELELPFRVDDAAR